MGFDRGFRRSAGPSGARLTRRDLVKLLGVTGAGVTMLGLSACAPATKAKKQGGTVTVVTSPISPTPALPHQGSTAISAFIRGTLYETLVGFDPATGRHDLPWLAESWTHSDDLLTWTFRLRKGVKFHRGAGELTSEDVKFSVELIMRDDSVAAEKGFFKQTISNMETPDPYTIVFRLSRPNVISDHFTNFDSSVLITSKSYLVQMGEKGAAGAPVGTGPYVLDQLLPNQSYEYSAFPDYWGRKPDFSGLKIRFVAEETTRLAMLQSGEADIADIPKRLIGDAKGAGLTVKAAAIPTVTGLYWFGSMYKPDNLGLPWKDKRVREALNISIDRKAIIDGVLKGLADPFTFHLLGPNSPGYEEIQRKPYAFDPQRAKQLIADAGFATGFDLVLRPYALAGVPEINDVTQAVASQWSTMGVRTEIQPIDGGSVLAAYRSRQEMRYIFSTRNPYNLFAPEALLQTFYQSKDTFGGIGQPDETEVDKQFEILNTSGDPGKRAQAMARIGQIVHDGFWNIPIAAVRAVVAFRGSRISDWVGTFGYGFDGLATLKSPD